MSRSNIFTKKFASGSNGAPIGEFTKEVNIADISVSTDVTIFDEFSWPAQVVSCQVIAKGLAGDLNGTVQLVQSNDGETFDVIPLSITTLNLANMSDTIEKADFSGKYVGVRVSKVGLTVGTVKLVFIVKHR